MTVRTACSGDVDRVLELAWAFGTVGAPDRGVAATEFARIVGDPDWLAVADNGDALVGYALAQDFRPGLRCDFTTGRLHDLYVDPDARLRGVGRSLMAAVVHWARNRPMPMILDWQASSGAVAFYERLGYTADTVGDYAKFPGFCLDTRGTQALPGSVC